MMDDPDRRVNARTHNILFAITDVACFLPLHLESGS